MIGELEAIEDEDTRKRVFDALAGIDAVHREALHRLVRLFKEGVLEQVATDPAINSLMGMYDLLPPEEPGCRKIWDFVGDGAPGEEPEGVQAAPPGIPPHWTPAPAEAEPVDDSAYVCNLDEGRILLVRVEGTDYAVSADCPEHGVPLDNGKLDNVMWHCPKGPGCSYDVRDGKRLGGGKALECHPVRVEADGRRMIGFGMPFEPKLPAF